MILSCPAAIQDCVQVRVFGVGKAGLEITQHLINMLKVCRLESHLLPAVELSRK
jgi:hypothetical protein